MADDQAVNDYQCTEAAIRESMAPWAYSIQSGFQENAIDLKKTMQFCPSIADCILKEQKALQSDTL